MNPKDFKNPVAGRLVKTAGDFWAFVPAPLPPRIDYSPDLVVLLSRADSVLSELSGLGRHLPNPHLLITPYMRREAVMSSRIEGTQTSLSDLFLEELRAGSSTATPDDAREVKNYVKAMDKGIRRLSKLPLSLRLVRELHATLMEGVRGQEKTPGEFRRSQNWIGPAGSTPDNAPYVPPPLPEMDDALDDWQKFLHRRGQMPELIQCAIMHEQFEAIHPFLDGNGRVGRLLITLFLIERNRLSLPLLYLSAFIEAHRQDYYDLLQRVRTHGDWTAWIRFFLEGIAVTAKQAVQQADTLLSLRRRGKEALKNDHRAVVLLDALFVNPYITVSRAAELLDVTTPTAAKAIAALERVRLLHEATGRTWGRLFVARSILAAIEKPLPTRPLVEDASPL